MSKVNNNLNIIILFSVAFPVGAAATNRTLTIAKCLTEGGSHVKVLCVRPTEKSSHQVNKNLKGCYEGVQFEYTTNSLIWPNNKIGKLYVSIKGFIRSVIFVYNLKQKKKLDFILSTGNYGFIFHIIYSLVCKIIKVKFIYAIDEYPWFVINKSEYNRVYSQLYIKYFYKLFDGLIVITKTLIEYYKDKVRKDCKFFHFPMTVEPERFLNPSRHINERESYIAYCGGDPPGAKSNKDGVDILINAFKVISDKFKDIKLYIIGPTNDYRKKQVENLNLVDKVVFTGLVHRNMIPVYLSGADILALARPNNIQAKGGFPTKLGEYLLTGKPVVLTKVGDISDYLTDGENAFLSEADDYKAFARKLYIVLSNPDLAKKVGSAGKELALKEFNYHTYSKSLKKFIENMKF